MREQTQSRQPMLYKRKVQLAQGPSSSLLRARHLAKAFGGNLAVDDVSLELHAGRLVGLVGPNGAGKSTLGNLLCGTLSPDGGEILLEGRRVDQLPPYHRARLGIARTFQLSSEFSRLTVLENLLVAGALRHEAGWLSALARRRRWKALESDQVCKAQSLLGEFELSRYEGTYAGNLSGGQRRLVEIARALMGDPKVLLLDEPMAGLSPHMVARVVEHLDRLRLSGLALLLVEHNVGVVASLSDRIIVMSQGAVIAEGESGDVLGNEEVQAIYVAG